MKRIKLSDFTIIPLLDTVRKEEISDDIYFSKEYSNYISNSRLKLINPEQDGSPSTYQAKQFESSTTSLQIGSAVHQLFLQKDEFTLKEGLNKPSAKLGQTIDKIKIYRKKGYNIMMSILLASQDVGYYAKSLSQKKINTIIQNGFAYYWKSRHCGNESVILSDNDTAIVKNCLDSLFKHKQIDTFINAKDVFGTQIPSYNEDAIFMDILVKYKKRASIVLKLKMKADNWTVDEISQILTLNDLKTTGKPLPFFMKDYGSFYHFHYGRQMAMYSWMLQNYCKKYHGFNDSWTCESNMLVVETLPPYRAGCFKVPKKDIEAGMEEMEQLLKRVAYYEMKGYSPEVSFI